MKYSFPVLNNASKIVLPYLIVAGLWIYFSDHLLSSIVEERVLMATLQTWKGLFFVLTTSALLYLLVNRTTRKLEQRNREIDKFLRKERMVRRSTEQSREKLERVLFQAPSPICILEGPDHVYSFANRAYRELMNHRRLIGIPLKEALSGIEDQQYIQILDDVYQNGEYYFGKEEPLRVVHDGTVHTYYRDVVYQPMYDDEEDIYGVFVQLNDITRMVEARHQLEEMLGEKEILLAELHHRVKNNLAVIVGLIDLQSYEVDSPRALAHLRSTQSRIHVIADIHELMYRGGSLKDIQVPDLIRELVTTIFKFHDTPDPEIAMDIDRISLNINQAVPLGLILNEIFSVVARDTNGKGSGKLHLATDLSDLTTIRLELRICPTDSSLPEHWNSKEPSLKKILLRLLLKQLQADLNISETDVETVLILSFRRDKRRGSSSTL